MTAAPRLAVITNDYPPKAGGIQQYLGNLVAAYPGPVCVLAPAVRGVGDDEIVRRGQQRFMWPTSEVAVWMESRLEEFAPEAILFGAPHPLPVLADRLRTSFPVPIGVLCHGAEVTIPAAAPIVRQTLAAILRSADVCFAVSRYTADRVTRLTGRQAFYLGAGVDLDRFVPRAAGPTGATPVVGCVSRFVPRKGQRRLLDAVAEVRRRGMQADVLLVGKGRDERMLRAAAERLGVPTRFAVGVPWDALPGLYAEMDVFCMPCRSRWGGLEVEGLGLVFLEAAAVGLPVVAGDSGGAPETVIPGETGYVVHDRNDVVEALELLLRDPDGRAAMGREGRRRAEVSFTWQAVVDRLAAGFAMVPSPGVS